MAGYVIKKKKSYPIKGSDGKMYLLPPKEQLSFDDITLVGKYDKAEDFGEKGEIAKEFILRYAEGLDNDPEIGDNEFSLIFVDYIQTMSENGGKSVGE